MSTPAHLFLRAAPVVVAVFAATAQAAGLFQCTTPTGAVAYAAAPCAGAVNEPVSIDRPTLQEGRSRVPDDKIAARRPAHKLTAEERARVLRLRQAQPELPAEAALAAEIEIAALREGADALLTAEGRAARERLREALRAPDPASRQAALAEWRDLYAAHRESPRPRVQPSPPGLGERPQGHDTYPAAPLGQSPPGTRGPLLAAPAAPTLPAPSALVRPGPVADPATGRVLTPAGDRLVDPLTGTMWLRSGRSYVDPLTGRTIPAP